MNLHNEHPVQHPMLLNEIRNYHKTSHILKEQKNEILMGPNHPIFSGALIPEQSRKYFQPRFDPIINPVVYTNADRIHFKLGEPNFDHLHPPNFNFGDFI